MEKAVENHFITEKCKNIDKLDFPKRLNATITSCNLRTKLIEGFESTGLYPFDKNKIPKSTL